MAERYKRTKGVLLRRIGSFFRRLFGLKSKEQYLDDKKMNKIEQSEIDEPQRLTITDTTEDKEPIVQDKEVEEEIVDEKEDTEPEAVITEIVEPAVEVSAEDDGYDNEDSFYSEY